MSEAESIRILKSMCSEGNFVAIAYRERAQRREIPLLNEHVDVFDGLSINPSSALLEPDLSPDDLDGYEHGVRSGFIEPTENGTTSPDSFHTEHYPDKWTEISDKMKSTRGGNVKYVIFTPIPAFFRPTTSTETKQIISGATSRCFVQSAMAKNTILLRFGPSESRMRPRMNYLNTTKATHCVRAPAQLVGQGENNVSHHRPLNFGVIFT